MFSDSHATHGQFKDSGLYIISLHTDRGRLAGRTHLAHSVYRNTFCSNNYFKSKSELKLIIAFSLAGHALSFLLIFLYET